MVGGPAPTGQHRTAPDSSGQLPNSGQLLGQLQLSKPSPWPQSLPLASWQKLKNEDGTFREAGSKIVGMRTGAELAAAAHALLRF